MTLENLGEYRIDAEIGRGGMGVVYRATHGASGRTVAIKVLPAELARDPGFADRFAREISALQKLNHVNIVTLIEPGEDRGYQFYVMEYVDGKSLDAIITAERRLPWLRAVEIGIQVCHGLKHAHDHGVIHRDLKPANLLITSDGTVKLTDFGIAKVFAGTAITATGGILGTPEYMSPEQGDGRPITRRSDLYSFGVVLYAMLTGRVPFRGRSMAELLNQHRFGQFDRPSAIVPEIPSWLDELVGQLLEKDPDKRPPDAHVVARRLQTVQKKVALRSAQTVVEDDATLVTGDSPAPRRRPAGPATLMQRLLRAQLRDLDQPGWFGALLQKTWVLAIALVLAVGALTLFTVRRIRTAESRLWREIERMHRAEDELQTAYLLQKVQAYLDRFPGGRHGDAARGMIPKLEAEQQRREFVRSDAIKDLRPRLEPASELERLYRKALLQLWTDGDAAARATLEEIVARKQSAGDARFLVELAEEDLAVLDLQLAAQLEAAGEAGEARMILQRIVRDLDQNPRTARTVRAARKALDRLPAAAQSANP